MPFLLAISFHTIQTWMTHGGFVGGVAVTFVLLFACGVGLPLPEDIPLIIAGALLCTDPKSWVITAIAAWCGIIGGDIVLYSMGRRFGLEITRVPFVGKHVTRERIESVQQLFEQYGVGVVAFGRMIAGIRGAMVVCAGTIRFNFIKFIIADGLAAIVSGGVFMLVGHWIGEQLNDPAAQKKIHEFKEFFLAGGIILVLGFVLFILWRRKNLERLHNAEQKVVEKAASAEKAVTDKIVQTAEKIVKKTPSTPPPSEPTATPAEPASTTSDQPNAR